MNDTLSPVASLPHHKLIAYRVAVELLLAVRAASIRDAKLRYEALRSAKSACLNCAEGAGRVRASGSQRSSGWLGDNSAFAHQGARLAATSSGGSDFNCSGHLAPEELHAPAPEDVLRYELGNTP